MPNLILIKARKNSNLFLKGQKLWEVFGTGALASYVLGRYRKNGPWIKAWVHFPDEQEYGVGTSKGFYSPADADKIGPVEVDKYFFDRINKMSS